jgi:hypothetical protein
MILQKGGIIILYNDESWWIRMRETSGVHRFLLAGLLRKWLFQKLWRRFEASIKIEQTNRLGGRWN